MRRLFATRFLERQLRLLRPEIERALVSEIKPHTQEDAECGYQLDPPFNSNANYNELFKEESGEESAAQIHAFEGTWGWGNESEAAYNELVTQGPKKLADLMFLSGTSRWAHNCVTKRWSAVPSSVVCQSLQFRNSYARARRSLDCPSICLNFPVPALFQGLPEQPPPTNAEHSPCRRGWAAGER